jgi:hypothetical protein
MNVVENASQPNKKLEYIHRTVVTSTSVTGAGRNRCALARASGLSYPSLWKAYLSPMLGVILVNDLSLTLGKFFVGLSLALGTLKTPKDVSAGLVWQVRGTWQVEGKSALLRDGDAIEPSSLLQAGGDPSQAHSIVILLPDGQHTHYECFREADCVRGFRVPALNRKPAALEVDILARFRAVMDRRHAESSDANAAEASRQISRDEAVAVLDPDHRVRLAGLLAALPPARYTCDLRPLDPANKQQLHLAIDKTESSMELTLPAPGLYVATITDAMSTPRVELFLAAISPQQSAAYASFPQTKAVIAKWNSEYFGWPVHDILRAYLESVSQTAHHPSSKLAHSPASAHAAISEDGRPSGER